MPSKGEKWNRFNLVELLGGGGMGEVFLALDASLNRNVALRVLPKRPFREIHSAATLDHPSICKIYDIGENEGHSFVAMEYVEGAPLQERLSGRPLSLDDFLRLGGEIAEALAAAHQKRIVHGGLKTADILVTADGHVKVMDFGLSPGTTQAGDENEDTTLSDRLTSQGQSPGTVSYMSPEQVRGEPLDARSDIFSLGVVLYEMATGALPFRGATSGLTYDAILNRGPKPPRELNPELPLELERILEKALDKNRDRRYPSAQELLTDLRSLKA